MEKILFIEPCAGLGNRLYALASAYYYYEKCKFDKMVIVWKKELPCSVDYFQIFDGVDHSICVKPLWQMNIRSGRLIYKLYSNLWLKYTKKRCKILDFCDGRINFADYSEDRIICELTDVNMAYIKSTGLLIDKKKISSVIGKITFSEEICKLSQEIIPDNVLVYGFHIRRTDNKYAIEKSPTQLFLDRIEDVLKMESKVKIFVATDDIELLKYINSKYKDAVISVNYYSTGKSRTTNDGMKDAVLDMLLLSRCKKLYLSKNSTFGIWAQLIGDCPFEYVSSGQ